MNENEYIDSIRKTILDNRKPSYQTTNKKEVRVRCPYCGDSKHDPSSAHLYIEMKPPFRFHCFKCETSGVLNQQTFKDLGIYDNNINLTVLNANKNFKSNLGIERINFKRKLLINTPIITTSSVNALNYFNNRYNTNYSNQYITEKFKAITDPINFFQENHIIIPNNQYNQFNYQNSIGFISADNSHIIFRDYSGSSEKRYNNLNLYPNDDLTPISKMYNITNQINIMNEKVKLVICEGIFDVIGVFTHIYKQQDKNIIFSAACGKAYNAVILNYIKKGFLNLNVEIYSDADVELNFYKQLKYNSPYLKNLNLTIFYNSLYDPKTKFGKDYGVPIEQIQLKKFII